VDSVPINTLFISVGLASLGTTIFGILVGRRMAMSKWRAFYLQVHLVTCNRFFGRLKDAALQLGQDDAKSLARIVAKAQLSLDDEIFKKGHEFETVRSYGELLNQMAAHSTHAGDGG
tara:strand:+ start:665 stop:1015 length:351 start_codon:yes stop_codon:yes gene_type:complete